MFGDLHKISSHSQSHSLEGEDRIALSLLRSIIDSHDSLFYVDIGCNDPETGNNTKLFYDLGKHGLCVDPLPSLQSTYSKKRPRDHFFSGAVGPTGSIEFYIFEDDTASSTDLETVKRYKDKFTLQQSVIAVQKPLDSILAGFGYEEAANIPLLSVDIEGSDLKVIRYALEESIHTFHVLIVEDKLVNIDPSFPNSASLINGIAQQAGYSMIAKTPLNSIYILRRSDIFAWLPSSMKYLD